MRLVLFAALLCCAAMAVRGAALPKPCMPVPVVGDVCIEEARHGEHMLAGHVRGEEGRSSVVMSRDGRTISAQWSGGVHRVFAGRRVDEPAAVPDELQPLVVEADAAPEPAAAGAPTEWPHLDLLVAWTPAAEREAGGRDAMLAMVDVAEAETRQGWQRSGLNATLSVVDRWPMPAGAYRESSSFQNDLQHVCAADGALLRRRDEVGADLAVVLRKRDARACGIAYVQTQQNGAGVADRPCALVTTACATGYYSFGHELGHLLGAQHDVQHSGSQRGMSAHAHGHYWGGAYRSVLAYQDTARATARVNYLSNPAVVDRNGQPTGTAAHNNVEAMRIGVARAARWR